MKVRLSATLRLLDVIVTQHARWDSLALFSDNLWSISPGSSFGTCAPAKGSFFACTNYQYQFILQHIPT